MNRIFIIALLIVLILPVFGQEYKIIDTKTNKEIKLKEMAERLSDYDVIFFGEYHDNRILHSLEFELLKMFYANNKNMIVSMEMFERDVQPVLDQFLNDEISEEDLRQRGQGDLFGARQHGLPDLKFVNMFSDRPIMEKARDVAFTLIQKDPQLLLPIHLDFRNYFLAHYADKLDYAGIG